MGIIDSLKQFFSTNNQDTKKKESILCEISKFKKLHRDPFYMIMLEKSVSTSVNIILKERKLDEQHIHKYIWYIDKI